MDAEVSFTSGAPSTSASTMATLKTLIQNTWRAMPSSELLRALLHKESDSFTVGDPGTEPSSPVFPSPCSPDFTTTHGGSFFVWLNPRHQSPIHLPSSTALPIGPETLLYTPVLSAPPLSRPLPRPAECSI